jgi:GT2 family glycosyltransferase
VKRVAVVVLNWNGKRDTARCLASLARLTAPPGAQLRVLVVDNGSSDGSLAELPARFPWARFLPVGENLRFAGGNNRGIRAALEEGADFVVILNNDTEADPDLVSRLAAEADASPRAGLCGPLILDAAGRVWFAGGGVAPALGWTWHQGLGGPDPGPERGPRDVGYLTGCCLGVRREVFERVGLLDEGYYLYAEDVDFCLRARAAGYACRYVPRARLTHFVSSSSGGAVNPFKAYQRTRAGLRLFARHARGWRRLTWPVGFATLTAAQAVSWVLRGRADAASAAARAFADALARRDPAEAFPAPASAGGPGAGPGAAASP